MASLAHHHLSLSIFTLIITCSSLQKPSPLRESSCTFPKTLSFITMKVYINLLVLPALALAAAVNVRSPDSAASDLASPDVAGDLTSPAVAAPDVASPDAASPDASPDVAADPASSPDVASPDAGTDLAAPDATPLVQMASAAAIAGAACPTGDFSRCIDANRGNTTLIFDKFAAYMGNKAADGDRERVRNYQIVLYFPQRCSSATVNITPRGVLRLTDNSFSAKFPTTTTYALGTPKTQTTDFKMNGPEFVSVSGDKPFIKFGHYTVTLADLKSNQKEVKMKIEMRATLQDSGKKDDNSFGIDSLDVSITDAMKC